MVTPQKIKPSKEQKAILASKKDTMVISNPGTGKTTTLAYKVLDLLDSDSPLVKSKSEPDPIFV